MRPPSADLRELFANTTLKVLPEDYVVIYLPPETNPLPPEWYDPANTRFAVVIRETEKLVMVMPRRKWLSMQSIFDRYEVDGPFRVIDLAIDPGKPISGYLTQIGAVMTEARIRTFPISSFRRNHLLVNKPDLPRTVKALRVFFESCKSAGNKPGKK